MTDADKVTAYFTRLLGFPRQLHRELAMLTYPGGARCSCGRCGATRDASVEEIGKFYAFGWPQHCGEAMTIEAIR